MDFLKINKLSATIIIIIFSFFLSIIISNYNLKNYDKLVSEGDTNYHQMIKYDVLRYLSHGAEIKKDIENNINFFETGRENFTKYLPPRIAALVFSIFDIELYKDNASKEINTGVYKPYLYIQCVVYFLSILVFYFLTKNSLNKKMLFFTILFLSIEPTIFQYHSTFWSESYFFSFQIIILGLILCSKKNNIIFFFIGFFLGLLTLQKQYAIFYIVPILIYFSFFNNRNKVVSLSILILGFLITQLFIGYNNLKRSGVFYVLANDNNIAIHLDLVPKVINNIKNYSGNEFVEYEGEVMRKWMIENNINFDDNSEALKDNKHFMHYRESIIDEADKLKFDSKIRSRTIDYFKEYPREFLLTIIKNGVHIILLNPYHIYSDHNFKSGEVYYFSQKHDDLVPYRILYTFIIYSFCLYGLYLFVVEKNYKILLILTLSILYFYLTSFWHGNTRYFVPGFLYFALFFGKSLEKIFDRNLRN